MLHCYANTSHWCHIPTVKRGKKHKPSRSSNAIVIIYSQTEPPIREAWLTEKAAESQSWKDFRVR